MRNAEAPEFSLERPLPSALAVIGAVLFSPKNFYLNFSAEGPMREPAIFVLLVGAVTGVLTAAVAIGSGLIFGEVSAGEVGLTALEALIFALLSPLAVGVVAGGSTCSPSEPSSGRCRIFGRSTAWRPTLPGL